MRRAPPLVALPRGIVVEEYDFAEMEGLSTMRLSAMDPLIVAHNQLGIIRQNRLRDQSLLGHVYNRLTGQETEHVYFDGAIVAQLLTTAGETVPPGVKNNMIYKLRFDDAWAMKVRAEAGLADAVQTDRRPTREASAHDSEPARR